MTVQRRPAGPRAARVGLVLLAVAILALAACAPSGSSGIAKGQPVPNITGTTLDGSAFDLAALRGRPVIINFWGPSCVPCRTEFPLLVSKAAQHQADGLAMTFFQERF